MDVLSLSEGGWEQRTVPLWLHRDHGQQASQLEAIRVPATDGRVSVAQAFAAAAASGTSEPIGLPCRAERQQLFLDAGGGQSGPVVTPLFLAEASCAPLSSRWPDLAVIAIVPPAGGPTLRVGSEAAGSAGWFVLSRGARSTHELLDALSGMGCLRGDLEEAFSPPSEGDGVIGEGAYGTVQRMRGRDGVSVAVKRMNANVGLDTIEREVATLLDVQRHDYIVGYRGIFWTGQPDSIRLAVAFEIAPRGDLLCRVLKHGAVSEGTAKKLFIGMMSGLQHIHDHNIVHRDIKAENVLLKTEDCPLIADFGLATWISDEAQMARRCGSPGYVAPEICLGTDYSFKVDVFGAGVVLYFMLSKEVPFTSPDRDTAATMRKTVKCSLHLHKPPWEDMSSRLRNVLRQMICKNVDERLSAADSLKHPWVLSGGEKHKSSASRGERSEVPSKHVSMPESKGYPQAVPGGEASPARPPMGESSPGEPPKGLHGTFDFSNE